MKKSVWAKALKAAADPHRVRHFVELLSGTTVKQQLANVSAREAAILSALFSGAEVLSGQLVVHPDWLALLQPERLKYPRRKQGFRQEVDSWLQPWLTAADYAVALGRLREFKEREALRIAARDLAWVSNVPEITRELSDLADVCLNAVWQVCYQQLAQRHGEPWHPTPDGRWQPTAGCVLGLGKLGGQELNYNSDVDVVFVYSEEGEVFKEPPGKTAQTTPYRSGLKNHQFFNRLAEAFIAEVTRLSPEGTLYRIDLRLRPEGDLGPLSRSLAAFENYYAQWGQTWERMMLIKARGVAGDDTLAAEFLEMIQPFRYPRSVNQSVLREVGAMKDRIENEVVKAGELDRNVKLGRGGIREIEFVVQSLQLLHGGRQPFLQGAQTLPCLEKLVQYERLSADATRALRQAYCFLRAVEHRLQMDYNRQTHTIPADKPAVQRLARLMQLPSAREFESVRQAHAAAVRGIFEKVLQVDTPPAEVHFPFPRHFGGGAEAEWKSILAQCSFKDVDKAFRVLREFVEGPGYVHVSPRTQDLALSLLPRLFGKCPKTAPSVQSPTNPNSEAGDSRPSHSALHAPHSGGGLEHAGKAPLSDPDRVVTRLDSFISAYGARATLFELWHSNPVIFDLLVLLFDRSEFLAELAIRTPDLVDELVAGDRLRQRKTTAETLRDLRHGLNDADQHLWLRRYHQAELMRIGCRDILGLADFEQYLTELSALADACLQYALGVVMQKNRLEQPPLAIIGLGKLGGAELDYGSDLDIVFVANPKAKNLPKLSKLALEVMDLVSSRTEQGVVFHTDARLRPDGEKGLLVNTLTAYEEYYRHRAQLWEIQALTRTRPVAGDSKTGQQFHALAERLANFASPSLPLNAYRSDWKQQIHQMRMRIEKERTPRGKADLAIKTGVGGLVDAEFIAQALCLEHGWREANTLRVLQKAQEAGALPEAGKLIDNYRRLRRLEGILRRWSYEGESVLPDDPAPYYRVSIRCGFNTPQAFREALAGWRKAIREVYARFFAVGL